MGTTDYKMLLYMSTAGSVVLVIGMIGYCKSSTSKTSMDSLDEKKQVSETP